MKTIDVHAHFLPQKFVTDAAGEGSFGAVIKEGEGGKRCFSFMNGDLHPYEEVFFDMEARKKELDDQKIDLQGISIAPRLFYYDQPAPFAAEFAAMCNEAIYDVVREHGERFFGVGTVPLQDTEAAVKELTRIHEVYGFRSIQIGTELNGKSIADPQLIPFYEAVEKLGMTVLIHPFFYGPQKFLEDYYLVNFIGNPLYTTIAAAHLIFSGMLERFPRLKFVLCHGGGFLPYQIARFDHGYLERAEARQYIDKPPSYYFRKNFYFDTILHDPLRTEKLVELAGADRVLLGTDYPYDMADHEPFETVSKLRIPEDDRRKILCENAQGLFL